MARSTRDTTDPFEEVVDALDDRDVELVRATERELDAHGLAPTDVPLFRRRPVVIDAAKLAALGWDSTPHAEAVPPTVDEHLAGDRTGHHHGPDRALEQRAIDGLTA